MNRARLAAALATALLLPLGGGTAASAAETTAVTVDFTAPVAEIAEDDLGVSITGYGGLNYIVNSPEHRKALTDQGITAMRIELRYQRPGDPTSRIVCGGVGCHTDYDGDQWIAAIRELGAQPMLVLPADPDDAVSLYRHFAATGTVPKVIVGNELDAGNPPRMDAAAYAAVFAEIATAIHAENPDTAVGGPGTTHNNLDYLRTFLENAGEHVDFVDYHDYGMGETTLPDEQLLAEAADYARDIAEVRELIAATVPDRADRIGIQIGEWNMHHGDKSPDCPAMTSHLPTVWGAAALGTMLEADATALLYGDKNGCLGLTGEWGEGTGDERVEPDEPMPIYHALGMFTGENRFRGFGKTMVRTDSGDAKLYVFASTGERSVVLVNTATVATTAGIDFTGMASGNAAIWRTTEAARAPHADGTATVAGSHTSVELPARSVTTLVID